MANFARFVTERSSFVRLIVVTAIIFVVFSLINPAVFLAPANIQFVLLSAPELALLSLAISIAMLTAGIDLSVVGISNVAAICGAHVMLAMGDTTLSVIAGILTALVTGVLCGLVNALLIAKYEVPPILATLGTQQLFSGLALVLSSGTVILGLPHGFTQIALTTFAGIPVIFWIMAVVTFAVWLMIQFGTLGFAMRLIGSNETAARFSGISSVRVLTLTYMISGLLAGFAGVIISSRAGGANSQYGTSYILLAIVVAVLAGVDPEGGRIQVTGVIIAVIALQCLATGLLSIQNSPHVVNVAQGLLLILMVALNSRGKGLPTWLRSFRTTKPVEANANA